MKRKIGFERKYLASGKRIEFRIERRKVTPWAEVALDEVLKDAQKVVRGERLLHEMAVT